ncbi:hypothetical protein [Streptomyces sp. bgisy060]|uniref:hypothetical protein n=1 Tax=Streptomyces sp. bgisy060 TaxID=3413775 RepID=UPI003EB971F7
MELTRAPSVPFPRPEVSVPAIDPILPPTNGLIRRSGSTAADTGEDTGTVSLDALAARRARSLPPGVRYELKDVVFTLPPVRALPVDLPERTGGDAVELLRLVLGEDVISEMAAAGFTLGDFELICEDWRRRNGLAAGTGPLLPADARSGGPR